MSAPILVSHVLCPYVQRAAIALMERDVPFERVFIDLANKPDWFTAISPLGKVPLLRVPLAEPAGEAVIFESAVILEYLEETLPQPLHPADPLERARHRGWMEVGSTILNAIARLYSAKSEAEAERECLSIRAAFARVEAALADGGAERPYFSGPRFSLVDAVFAPIFRYFDAFEGLADLRLLDGSPKLAGWRRALAERPSVRAAAHPDYPALLADFLRRRDGWISQRMLATV